LVGLLLGSEEGKEVYSMDGALVGRNVGSSVEAPFDCSRAGANVGEIVGTAMGVSSFGELKAPSKRTVSIMVTKSV
jgi:hypothetical protein